MKNTYFTLALFSLAIIATQAANYAVLVAGTSGFDNYRYQADIFHAYNILIANGMPADNIVTMAYDDIANNAKNPVPGKVFNKPTALKPGKDVYAGVRIDYSGDDVNTTNFNAVLFGDSVTTGGKRVIHTTEEDNIFIYIASYGSTGLISFPKDGDYLYAADFVGLLNMMRWVNLYKQMVIYIEASESGSVFENLLGDNLNIYATTSSNPAESSSATYCFPNNIVGGVTIQACLGDLYSVSFLENLESIDPNKQTLQEQFDIIKNLTTKSHVQQYGNLTIANQVVGKFEGNNTSNTTNLVSASEKKDDGNGVYSSVVDSRLGKLHYLQNQHSRLQSQESHQELADELESIQRFDSYFEKLASKFDLDLDRPIGEIDFDCLKMRVGMYEKVCGRFSGYGLKYVKYLHFSCAQGVDIYDFEETLLKTCA